MKRFLLIFALIFITVIANAQEEQTPEQRAKLEAAFGIRNIILNTPKSDFKDLEFTGNGIPCGQFYRRENEDSLVLGIKTEEILYFFIKDKLSAVWVFYESGDRAMMFYELTQLYGEPNFIHTDGSSENDKLQKGYHQWKNSKFCINGFARRLEVQVEDLEKKCKKNLNSKD